MVVDLNESREKIDKIDKEIARLFEERLTEAVFSLTICWSMTALIFSELYT